MIRSPSGSQPIVRLVAMAIILLVSCAAGLQAASVSASAPSPVADEATSAPGQFLVQRDTTAGNLVINFTLGGTAVSDTDYTISCPSTSANLVHAPGASTGTIIILNNDASETLVITPKTNGVKGDLKVILTIAPGAGYTVVAPSNAQVDIAEGQYTATVSVPAPIATEDTAVVDFSYDPGAGRRGVMRVAFTNTVSPGTPPSYDKALKVQFGGNPANPATIPGPGVTGADYDLLYKIGGSALGSSVDPSNGVGFNVVAYLANGTINAVFLSGANATIPNGSTVYFNGDTSHPYTVSGAFTAPGLLHLTSPLVVNVHDGDIVTVDGNSGINGRVSSPLLANSTTCFVENGHGSISFGDVFTISGDPGALFVVTSVTPITGSGQITFRHYSGGTSNSSGVDATIVGSPAISTVFPVVPNNVGIVQLLVPAESAQVDFGVAPVADGVVEGHESVTMTLFQNFNYASVAPTSGELTIADADVTASIQATANAVQNATPATFQVQLTSGFPASRFPSGIAIPFTIVAASSTAVAGVDYDFGTQAGFTAPIGGQPGTLTIAANATTGTITLIPRPTANLGAGGKTVTLQLSPTTDYLLATPTGGTVNSTATLSLLPAQPPKPAVTIALLDQASEAGPTTGHFRVTSLTAPTSDISVTYNLSGTAVPGTEYTLPYVGGSGTVTIHGGSTFADIPIAPITVAAFNPTELVTATLIAGSGYDLGSPTTANMLIAQNEIGVLAVTSLAPNATYTIGDIIPITVTFSAPVAIGATNPTLALNAGASAQANYQSGDGTTTLTFNYTVGAGDSSPDLDYTATNSLSAATIHDAGTGGLTVDLALAAPGALGSLGAAKALVIDGRPTVTIVSAAPAPAEPSTAATFTVSSNAALPSSALTVTYQLSGTANPVTDYTPPGTTTVNIAANQTSATITIPIVDNAAYNPNETIIATLQSGSGYKLGSPASATTTVAQDTIVLTGVDSTNTDQTYHAGDTINITVSFTESVTVSTIGGTPRLLLSTGTGAVATYASGSPGTTLTFAYTVGNGDVSNDLDYLTTSSLSLNGGTITSTTAGKTVVPTLPSPGAAGSLSANRNLAVDGTPALNISSDNHIAEPSTNGIFTITSSVAPISDLTIPYTLGGSAAIGTDINVPGGTSSGTATMIHGTTTTTITIAPIDNPVLNPTETVTATIGAGTGYHLGSVTTASMTVAQDTIDPTGVTSPTADGTYHVGDTIVITIGFTSPVDVAGTPTLQLATGATNAVATYTGGSGTSTLSFTYTVAFGDVSADLDYRSTTALLLNGGHLTGDAHGETVHTVLPAPGANGSLGHSKALVIDGSGGGGKLPPGTVSSSGSSGGGCGLGSGIATLGALLSLACLAFLRRARR